MTKQVTNHALIASILANPSAHFVDKKEKMNRTIDKMIDNHVILLDQQTGIGREIDDSRGYGKGKNQGD